MTTQTSTDYAAAALRISTGVLFLAHGWMKVSVFTIPGTVGFFESLGLPAILAYATIFAELAGGIALILGLGTRLVSLALIPVLLGATWVHSGNGWGFSNEGGGWEYPLFWAVVQGVVAVLGRGALALRAPELDRRLGQFA
jgi:putative oxidoreductase